MAVALLNLDHVKKTSSQRLSQALIMVGSRGPEKVGISSLTSWQHVGACVSAAASQCLVRGGLMKTVR